MKRLLAPLATLALLGAGPPVDVAAANRTAQGALDRGDPVSAEVALRAALSAGAPAAAVNARLGQALLDEGDKAGARRALGAGAFTPETAGVGWRARGRLEMAEGRLPLAGQAFDVALRSMPDDTALWQDISHLRWRGGEQAQAYEAAERAAKLGPRDPGAMLTMAMMVRARAGLVPSLRWFEAGLMLAPANPQLLVEYAATLGDIGRYRDMLAVVRRLNDVSPNNPRGLFLQAVLAARSGRTELGRAILQRTGDKLRDQPAAIVLGAVLEYRAGNLNLAVEQFDRFDRLQPENRFAAPLLARGMASAGLWSDLAARFGSVAAQPAAPPYLAALVARAQEIAGDRKHAAPLLARAGQRGQAGFVPFPAGRAPEVLAVSWRDAPGAPGSAIPYARALLAAGQSGPARAVAEALVRGSPGLAEAHMLLADARAMSGDQAGALAEARVAATMRSSPETLRRIDALLRAGGKAGEADRVLAGYRAANPLDLVGLRLAANAQFAARRWADAAATLRVLRQRGQGGPAERALLAEAEAAQNHAKTALADLGAATRLPAPHS